MAPRLRGVPPDEPTDGELRVLRAYLATESIEAAARLLECHEGTVKSQLSHLRSRLGVRTTAKAVLLLRDKIAA